MIKKALSLLILFSPFILHCQVKNKGIPEIRNFKHKHYNAATQNWAVVQDDNGIMYFGNNDGVLIFDGATWEVIELPNKSIVRSLCVDKNNRVYVGAFNELGYLGQNKLGKIVYHSLTNLLPEKTTDFDEIWRIHTSGNKIIFQSFYSVFVFENNTIKILTEHSDLQFSYKCGEDIYFVHKKQGILILKDNELKSIISKKSFPLASEIWSIHKLSNNQLLLGTRYHGLFHYINGKVVKWKTNAGELLTQNQIYTSIKLPGDYFAFGTVNKGLIIISSSGEIVQHINRTNGLQNNTVLSMALDKQNNLWLGLDNGISYIELNSPFSNFNEGYGFFGSGYTSLVRNGYLYIGTNQGVFFIPWRVNNEYFSNNYEFKLIPQTKGQVWTLNLLGDEILCGHDNGTYRIESNNAVKISEQTGGWTFIPLNSDTTLLLQGNYTGLCVFEKNEENHWEYKHKVKAFNESSRFIVKQDKQNFWIAHGYKGLYRLNLNSSFDSVTFVRHYDSKSGFNTNLELNIYIIDNKLTATSPDGFYKYNRKRDNFTSDIRFNGFVESQTNVSRLFIDFNDDIWYVKGDELGVLKKTGLNNYINETIPFVKIKGKLVNNFENINFIDRHNILIGAENGFIHYDPSFNQAKNLSFYALIQNVCISGNIDSCIYFGGFRYSGLKNDTDEFELLDLAYKYNSLVFKYSATFYEQAEENLYSYLLKGFDDDWSDWTKNTQKEYTNLSPGLYEFGIKAKNIYGQICSKSTFSFRISPPWYRTDWAWAAYFILIAGIITGISYYFYLSFEKEKHKIKVKQARELKRKEQEYASQSLIAEQKMINLKNEKLAENIKHKNKELANSTMNIIKKNEFLTTLKQELQKIVELASGSSAARKINKLIKAINKNMEEEDNWNVFEMHFDAVHENYLRRLKEKYPQLTPKDLRLCAYLKMNLSTKEIAPLLNISIRGVENSRYRLRKKLDLPSEENLTDFLMRI